MEQIRAVLAGSPFHGEGHRKVWARLRVQGFRTSKPRALRLMREHELLAPQRPLSLVVERSNEGSIVTSAPNPVWGTLVRWRVGGFGRTGRGAAFSGCAPRQLYHEPRH